MLFLENYLFDKLKIYNIIFLVLFLNNWKGETMSKAQIAIDTYDNTQKENASSEACYDAAWSAAKCQGGIETWNSNKGLTSGTSFAPNRIFKFDDNSYVEVTYGGAYILTEEDLE